MKFRRHSKVLLVLLFTSGNFCNEVSAFSANLSLTSVYKQLSAKVISSDGKVLSDVTIVNLSTKTSVKSSMDGSFVIQANEGDILQFTLMGYESLKVKYDGSQRSFTMLQKSSNLDEVVVVGYGSQKKSNLSGAVDYLNAEALESRPISNVSQGLQGLVPNLNVQFNSGAPGEAAKINVRGITSINGGDPLILVDNVPVSSAELNRISPQDIESFSVIKDASASAIYGARASFGVILITTKSGKGGLKISYNNNFTFNTPTVMPDKIVDPYVFSRLLELSTDNTPWDNVNYSDQFYKYAKDRSDNPSTPGVRIDPSNAKQWEYMGNRDWTRYFLSDWNSTQNHDLSLSGSTEKLNYYLSTGYNRQNSPIKLADDYFDRYTIRSKMNYSILSNLKVGNNIVISNTSRQAPSQYNLFDIYNVFPTSYDINPDGSWANSQVGRMAARMVDGGSSNTKRLDVQSTFTGELGLFDNKLKINTDYTFQRNSMNYNYAANTFQIGYGPNDIRTEGTNSAYRQAGFSYYNVYNIYGTYS